METQGRSYKNHFVEEPERQTDTHARLPDADKEAKKKNASTDNKGVQGSTVAMEGREEKVRRKDTRGHKQRQTGV